MELERGDVVVFKREGRLLVKRIAGVSGDIVHIASGEALTVPDGCFFMLGDYGEVSNDSRYWNNPFVSTGDIIAKIVKRHPSG